MAEKTQSSVTLLDVASVAKQLANITQDYLEGNPEQEVTEILREAHSTAWWLWFSLIGVTTPKK